MPLKPINKICIVCHKSSLLRPDYKCCSKKCSNKLKSISRKGKPLSEEYKQALRVPRPGAGIYKRTSDMKTGKAIPSIESRKLMSLAHQGINAGVLSPWWKGGKPKCNDCHKIISYGAEYCCKHVRIGDRNHKWFSDRGKLKKSDKRNDPAYMEWRQNILNRDKWKCRIFNQDCIGKIEIHHILSWSQYPELRYEVNNGITLCHFHHPHKRKDEIKLSPYLKELVNMKM